MSVNISISFLLHRYKALLPFLSEFSVQCISIFWVGIVKLILAVVKYNRLVRFNMWIIGLSLSMDVLIISMMSLKNSFVYVSVTLLLIF